MIDGAHISEDNCSTKCTHVRLLPLNRYDHCTGRFKKKKKKGWNPLPYTSEVLLWDFILNLNIF